MIYSQIQCLLVCPLCQIDEYLLSCAQSTECFAYFKSNSNLRLIIDQLSILTMKIVLAALALFGIVSAQKPDPEQFEAVKKCIYERCPTEASKCDAKCEKKLEDCAGKCGLKINQTCWAGCVGLFGPATNAALCAANKGCLASGVEEQEMDISFEQIGKLIDDYLRKQ